MFLKFLMINVVWAQGSEIISFETFCEGERILGCCKKDQKLPSNSEFIEFQNQPQWHYKIKEISWKSFIIPAILRKQHVKTLTDIDHVF